MKPHSWMTFVAFALMVLFIEAPLLWFPFYAGDAYQGINIAHFGNDEHHYLTRAKEVLEGHNLGQPYLAEGKDLPDSFHSNVEQVALFPLVASGVGDSVDVVVLYNFLNAVAVFVLLVLIYLLVYRLSKDRLLSTAIALFVIGGYHLIQDGTVFSTLIRGEPLFSSLFNLYGRSVFPYALSIPFFAFFILTYLAVKDGSRLLIKNASIVTATVAAGVLFGFLFYDAFYAWTFALAFLGSLAIGTVLWRKWYSTITVAVIGVIGIAIGSFKLASYYTFFTSDFGAQISYFFLTVYTHAPVMSTTGIATALLFAFYWYRYRDDPNNLFIFATILAGWVALEQQVVTGRSVQYGHYYWYFVVPLSILVALYMAVRLLGSYRGSWARLASIALILIAFVNVAGVQYQSFPTTIPGKMREQDFAPIITKLQNLPTGVILGDPGTESYPLLFTIYTDNDLYWVATAVTSLFPIEHLREALLVYLYLDAKTRAHPTDYLNNAIHEPSLSTTAGMYKDLEGYASGVSFQEYSTLIARDDQNIVRHREKLLQELDEEYGALTRSPQAVKELLHTRGIKYILWDQKQYPEWDLSVLEPLTILATSTNLILYELPAF